MERERLKRVFVELEMRFRRELLKNCAGAPIEATAEESGHE